jgi:hypothetical protein
VQQLQGEVTSVIIIIIIIGGGGGDDSSSSCCRTGVIYFTTKIKTILFEVCKLCAPHLLIVPPACRLCRPVFSSFEVVGSYSWYNLFLFICWQSSDIIF